MTNPSDALFSPAEISIALIGFAGIMMALRKSGGEINPLIQQIRIKTAVFSGASSICFCLTPMRFLTAGISGKKVFVTGSIISGIGGFVFLIYGVGTQRQGNPPINNGHWIPEGSYVTDSSIIAFSTFSLITGIENGIEGGFFSHEFSGYLCSGVFWLYVSLIDFF